MDWKKATINPCSAGMAAILSSLKNSMAAPSKIPAKVKRKMIRLV